ncbi:MAG: AAA family ATPase [Myxococcales bacterium]|nr:AAA family ATPase [Myxococcales bacterium]
MGTLEEDLGAGVEEVRETHISWVFLGSDRVWKVKKPVNFGFLDFSTLSARRSACEAEITLNRRLSPEIYLGLEKITLDASGRHRLGGEGEAIEWAVCMRRLPDALRLDRMLHEGRLTDAHLLGIARVLAAFHESCGAGAEIASFGSVERIAENVEENFEQTRASIHAHLSPTEAEEIERWQLRFLEERAPVFEARVRAHRVRDGHGDLRLEQIYQLEEGPCILDCIEFNERFRYADVCADVAFLSMDLALNGRVDLAERFLALYAREANDFDLYPLVDFYESYRAYVRGKIASFLAADARAPQEAREAAHQHARRCFLLALAAERRPLLPPIVVAVGGVLATGKSTLADALGRLLGAPVVETDRTRKFMLGARPTEHVYEGSWQGAYDLRFTDEVYEEVYRRAGVVLDSGRPILLDASFRSAQMRSRARRLAEERGLPFFFVECTAPRALCLERLAAREREGGSVSDGRIEIFDAFVAKWQPAEELPDGERLRIDTSRPLEQSLAALCASLPSWPEGLDA